MAELVGDWGGGEVWRITSGSFPSNSYICLNREAGGALLVDGGLDPIAIDAVIKELGVIPSLVCCTHGHFDHAGSAEYFQIKYGASVFMHKADVKTYKMSNFLLMAFGFSERIKFASITQTSDEERICIGGFDVTFIPTPGHTPGSCLLSLGNALFTGDTLYAQGVGLSDLPGEKPELLKKSILSVWDALTSNLWIFPGHGKAIEGDRLKRENADLLRFLGLIT
ncbi:MBL fold metallo-hydrolase [Polynucleobacter sp. JS-Polo-80-F4]|uniref:MBL fold metallo-hydrolase n=1 Tax=Polynucleobacter sp. JS-Polo-80-F4 TaxID=2576918 RepID=UPI001C0E704D|nr:MBL fold metallo-hydrolase [Polynucleobacter sp. JS-Polo-80-F4]MBU3616735.1 MBL fold metallo-hydrolase [Polynucleobacter sp. JS-Polo-80-F4]